MIPNLGSAANRLMTPWNFVPSVGKAGKIDVKPGDAEVILGGNLEITATPRKSLGHAARRPRVRSARRRSGNGSDDFVGQVSNLSTNGRSDRLETCPTRPPFPRFSNRFAIAWKSAIRNPRRFASRCARSRWWPRSASRINFRNISAGKTKPSRLKTPDLEAPQYTVAQLRIRPTVPVTKGYVLLDGKKYAGACGRRRQAGRGENSALAKRQLHDPSFRATTN